MPGPVHRLLLAGYVPVRPVHMGWQLQGLHRLLLAEYVPVHVHMGWQLQGSNDVSANDHRADDCNANDNSANAGNADVITYVCTDVCTGGTDFNTNNTDFTDFSTDFATNGIANALADIKLNINAGHVIADAGADVTASDFTNISVPADASTLQEFNPPRNGS